MEQWRDVIDYEGWYQISRAGQVRSIDRVVQHARFGTCKRKGKILRPSLTWNGYLKVILSKGGARQTILVHQLVATAWIGPYPKGQQIRHGPNGKLDKFRL